MREQATWWGGVWAVYVFQGHNGCGHTTTIKSSPYPQYP